MRFYLIILSLLFSVTIVAQDNMRAANELYEEKRYDEAIAAYESMLNTGVESAALYYNLGNAYFRMNDIAHAILNYERSLLLNPNNEDAKFNLELSQTKIVDKIDAVDTFFLRSWINGLSGLMKSNSWATLSIITFLLFIIGLFGYVFGRYKIVKKIAFFAACFLFLISLSSFFFAKMQKEKYMNREFAIVMDATVTVKSSPDESGTDLFLIHEGTKVKIRKVFENQEWLEIQLEDGNTGWIRVTTIERI